MNKNRKNKRKKKNRFYYFFFSIIGIYFLVKFAPVVMSSTVESEIVQFGNIQEIHKSNFYLIRSERLLKSNSEGTVKYFVQEGEKVKKGYKVAEIYKDTVDEATRKKLEIVNQRIESLNLNKDNLFDGDTEKIDKDINKMMTDLKEYKNSGDLLKIEEIRRELNNKLEKKRIIVGDKSFSGKNLEALKQEQQQLELKINNSVSVAVSPEAGIISYHVDGYESILDPTNVATINLDKLKSLENKVEDLRVSSTIVGQPLFKIVDNSTWYLVTWLDKEYLDYYKVGKLVEFKFQKGTIRGMTHNIVENEDNIMVIFKTDEYIEDFYKIRNIDLEVIAINYEGLKIHNDSIIEKDGKKGVYVLDVNRTAHFKPIKIIGQNQDYSIIKDDVFYEKIGTETKTISTIKLYDEIVRNGSKIKEDQVIY